jgi:predicted O-linked N-acetylglucosamine transferase (SPINDLY family)
MSADPVTATFQKALDCQRRGEVGAAIALYQEILAVEPRHAPSLHLLGSLALQRGDAANACDYLRQSIDVNPGVAAAQVDLGIALQSCGRDGESLACYDRALRLAPGLLAAHFNRAVLLQALGKLREALQGYERALQLSPSLVAALFNRAVVLADLHRPREALTAYDRCLQADPAHVEALTNRGALLLELTRPAEALVSLEAALRQAPRLAKALHNRGNALAGLRRDLEAVASFDAALAADPGFAEAHRARATALRQLGQLEAARAGFETALQLRPAHAGTLLDSALTLIDLKRLAEARERLTALLAVAPATDYAPGLRLHIQGLACDWQDYGNHRRDLIRSAVSRGRADFPFAFLSVCDSAPTQLRCARDFAADKYPPAPPVPTRRARHGHRRIRLAYVSGDLRSHPVAALLVGVLERHDRTRFETTAISLRPADSSPLGQRVAAAFDVFTDVSGMDDASVATLMREREIDIAIDLAGFTHGSRTAILAARPAPVQVNYLGYPGTMGAPYIDYLIGDEYLIPAESRPHYAEKIVWLPDCFQANDDRRRRPGNAPARRDLGLPDFGLVFCCFNNSFKLNPDVFDVWMRLLAAVPGSVLWLLAETPVIAGNLRREAQARGIAADRLVFANRVSYEDHLARLTRADLFLDTWPFNGGATVSDALGAGLPVVTLSGDAMAARMAGSLLRAMGFPELVTSGPADYEAVALRLATRPLLLSGLRERLESSRAEGPVFDTERFCRHLEAAYHVMWERAARGLPAEHIAVKPH